MAKFLERQISALTKAVVQAEIPAAERGAARPPRQSPVGGHACQSGRREILWHAHESSGRENAARESGGRENASRLGPARESHGYQAEVCLESGESDRDGLRARESAGRPESVRLDVTRESGRRRLDRGESACVLQTVTSPATRVARFRATRMTCVSARRLHAFRPGI